MFANGQTIIQVLENIAPKYLAYPDDKIGLQIGTLNKEVKKVMLTLDVLDEVLDEAISKNIDLIISHHAVIFKPLKNIRTDLPQGKLYEKLLKNNIAVYVAHTNLDMAVDGVNDVLSQKLELENVQILESTYNERLKKLVVYTPISHQQNVIDAMANAGAGWIGNYSHCTFNSVGIGTFLPRKGSNPYVGTEGKLEKVEEVKIETIVPEQIQQKVVRAMINAHPYEEVAFDIYPLDLQGKTFGIGRIGHLKQPLKLIDFAQVLKDAFEINGARIVGDLEKTIKRVAVVGGDGNSFVSKAAFKGADVLVTGDIYYHVAHDAQAQGLAVIDAGHNIEKHVLPTLQNRLLSVIKEKGLKTEVLISTTNTNPFQFI